MSLQGRKFISMAHATSVWIALLGAFMIPSVFGLEKSPEGWPDLQQSTGKIEIAKIQEKTGSYIDNIVSFFTSFFSPEETEVENDPNLDEVANVKQETGSEKPTCKTCGRIASSSDSKTKVLPEDEIKAIRLNMALKVLQEKLRLSPKELTLEETKNLLEEFDKTHSELPAPLLDQIDESDDQAEEDDFYAWDKRKIFAGRLSRYLLYKPTFQLLPFLLVLFKRSLYCGKSNQKVKSETCCYKSKSVDMKYCRVFNVVAA